MTLQELLDLKDGACKDAADAGTTTAEAREVLATAQAGLALAETGQKEAILAETEAHTALHVYLTEKGHHYLVADDGTVTIFHAIDEPPGWCAYQPIPGTVAASRSKGKGKAS